MPLADEQGDYHFLCFDFDTGKGNAREDARRFCAILSAGNIQFVATTSGPSGGRHVWIGAAEPIPVAVTARLADLAASLYPSLDTSPLKNPRTGSVRPPFSPHRVPGHVSQPDAPVDLSPLVHPQTTIAQLRRVANHLTDIGAELPAPKSAAQLHGVVQDASGPRLRGTQRKLSTGVNALLNAPCTDGEDLSLRASRILAGLARARYPFTDVVKLAQTAPGLEHFRSLAHPSGHRVPRTSRGTQAALERKWRYAVEFIASNPATVTTGSDDLDARIETVCDLVGAVQDAADAAPGLWAGSGWKMRLVLDVICKTALTAITPVVEIDVRRLSLATGYGRTACALAVNELVLLGWLERAAAADGVNGASYRIPEKFSTNNTDVERTQGVTRPPLTTSSPGFPRERDLGLLLLERRLHTVSDALFSAPRSLGRTSGRVAAVLPDSEVLDLHEVARAAGLGLATVRYALRELHRHGLVARLKSGWIAQLHDHTLRRLRQVLHVDGWADERAERYRTERYVWAWWSAELQWMRAKGKGKRRRKHAETAVPLLDLVGHIRTFPRYPKTPKNRGDHLMARFIAQSGGLGVSGAVATFSAA